MNAEYSESQGAGVDKSEIASASRLRDPELDPPHVRASAVNPLSTVLFL